MGSSAKTGKKFFRGSPEHFLDKNDIWDRTPLHLYIKCSLHVWGRVQGSQIFKWNSIISIRSKVMAFLVISLSLWSPRCPHIVPVIPMSSLCHSHHPLIIPIAPRRSPCGPHGCGLRGLHPMLSPWSPCCPHCPHVIPVIPTSSLCHPHIIPIAPTRSPCGPHGCGLRCLRGLHPMLSPWSPCCPRCPHVIPVIPTSSLCHPHIIPIAPTRSPCGPHGYRLRCLRGLHPMLSPWSPCPCCPHIIPVIPMSSPCCSHHLHVIPIAPRRFPCGPHGCGLHGLHPLLSPWSPCRPHHPHIIWKVPTSSLTPQIPTPPTPYPLGGGGPESVKMQ